MKNLSILYLVLCLLVVSACQQGKSQNPKNSGSEYMLTEELAYYEVSSIHDPNQNSEVRNDKTKIQVAILLDTSNSMDGLIDQAKSRLWNIVNTLTSLKFRGGTPMIEIALYEYGNSSLSAKTDYIRRITPFTNDLDLISEELFALKTNGGLECCGAVISKAVKQLRWSDGNADMKLIYIAGNEPFNQCKASYKESLVDALNRGIYVNTIYCGNYDYGISELWKDGADRGKGKYFNIDSDMKVRYISTPYDDAISRCNERLNKTYISYGSIGSKKQMNQAAQDKNAQSISSANYAERVVSKSKSVYKNDNWDLIDKVKEDKNALKSIEKKDLPKELQDKSEREIKILIEEKTRERETIQKEINLLAKKRQEYIDEQRKKDENSDGDDLGNAINSSILVFAKEKGYTY